MSKFDNTTLFKKQQYSASSNLKYEYPNSNYPFLTKSYRPKLIFEPSLDELQTIVANKNIPNDKLAKFKKGLEGLKNQVNIPQRSSLREILARSRGNYSYNINQKNVVEIYKKSNKDNFGSESQIKPNTVIQAHSQQTNIKLPETSMRPPKSLSYQVHKSVFKSEQNFKPSGTIKPFVKSQSNIPVITKQPQFAYSRAILSPINTIKPQFNFTQSAFTTVQTHPSPSSISPKPFEPFGMLLSKPSQNKGKGHFSQQELVKQSDQKVEKQEAILPLSTSSKPNQKAESELDELFNSNITSDLLSEFTLFIEGRNLNKKLRPPPLPRVNQVFKPSVVDNFTPTKENTTKKKIGIKYVEKVKISFLGDNSTLSNDTISRISLENLEHMLKNKTHGSFEVDFASRNKREHDITTIENKNKTGDYTESSTDSTLANLIAASIQERLSKNQTNNIEENGYSEDDLSYEYDYELDNDNLYDEYEYFYDFYNNSTNSDINKAWNDFLTELEDYPDLTSNITEPENNIEDFKTVEDTENKENLKVLDNDTVTASKPIRRFDNNTENNILRNNSISYDHNDVFINSTETAIFSNEVPNLTQVVNNNQSINHKNKTSNITFSSEHSQNRIRKEVNFTPQNFLDQQEREILEIKENTNMTPTEKIEALIKISNKYNNNTEQEQPELSISSSKVRFLDNENIEINEKNKETTLEKEELVKKHNSTVKTSDFSTGNITENGFEGNSTDTYEEESSPSNLQISIWRTIDPKNRKNNTENNEHIPVWEDPERFKFKVLMSERNRGRIVKETTPVNLIGKHNDKLQSEDRNNVPIHVVKDDSSPKIEISVASPDVTQTFKSFNSGKKSVGLQKFSLPSHVALEYLFDEFKKLSHKPHLSAINILSQIEKNYREKDQFSSSSNPLTGDKELHKEFAKFLKLMDESAELKMKESRILPQAHLIPEFSSWINADTISVSETRPGEYILLNERRKRSALTISNADEDAVLSKPTLKKDTKILNMTSFNDTTPKPPINIQEDVKTKLSKEDEEKALLMKKKATYIRPPLPDANLNNTTVSVTTALTSISSTTTPATTAISAEDKSSRGTQVKANSSFLLSEKDENNYINIGKPINLTTLEAIPNVTKTLKSLLLNKTGINARKEEMQDLKDTNVTAKNVPNDVVRERIRFLRLLKEHKSSNVVKTKNNKLRYLQVSLPVTLSQILNGEVKVDNSHNKKIHEQELDTIDFEKKKDALLDLLKGENVASKAALFLKIYKYCIATQNKNPLFSKKPQTVLQYLCEHLDELKNTAKQNDETIDSRNYEHDLNLEDSFRVIPSPKKLKNAVKIVNHGDPRYSFARSTSDRLIPTKIPTTPKSFIQSIVPNPDKDSRRISLLKSLITTVAPSLLLSSNKKFDDNLSIKNLSPYNFNDPNIYRSELKQNGKESFFPDRLSSESFRNGHTNPWKLNYQSSEEKLRGIHPLSLREKSTSEENVYKLLSLSKRPSSFIAFSNKESEPSFRNIDHNVNEFSRNSRINKHSSRNQFDQNYYYDVSNERQTPALAFHSKWQDPVTRSSFASNSKRFESDSNKDFSSSPFKDEFPFFQAKQQIFTESDRHIKERQRNADTIIEESLRENGFDSRREQMKQKLKTLIASGRGDPDLIKTKFKEFLALKKAEQEEEQYEEELRDSDEVIENTSPKIRPLNPKLMRYLLNKYKTPDKIREALLKFRNPKTSAALSPNQIDRIMSRMRQTLGNEQFNESKDFENSSYRKQSRRKRPQRNSQKSIGSISETANIQESTPEEERSQRHNSDVFHQEDAFLNVGSKNEESLTKAIKKVQSNEDGFLKQQRLNSFTELNNDNRFNKQSEFGGQQQLSLHNQQRKQSQALVNPLPYTHNGNSLLQQNNVNSKASNIQLPTYPPDRAKNEQAFGMKIIKTHKKSSARNNFPEPPTYSEKIEPLEISKPFKRPQIIPLVETSRGRTPKPSSIITKSNSWPFDNKFFQKTTANPQRHQVNNFTPFWKTQTTSRTSWVPSPVQFSTFGKVK